MHEKDVSNKNNRGKTLLLVEDDRFIADIYRKKITLEGFHFMHAGNGREALDILETTIPDLILLDVVMPIMDGIETLRRIKEDDRWKDIPIIILTNLSERDRIREGVQLGVCEYVIKAHFTPSEVMQKIEEVLKRRNVK